MLTFRVLEAHWKEAHMDKYIVKLTAEERAELLGLIRVGKKAANKLMHARVLLSADENDTKLKQKTDEEISNEMHISSKTVARIRQRFVEEGLESALSRRPHANPKSRKIDGEQEAHLVALCCSTPPEGRSRWTLKLLANKLIALEIIDSVSPTTIGRVLKKTKSNPGKRGNGAFLRLVLNLFVKWRTFWMFINAAMIQHVLSFVWMKQINN